MRVLGYSISGGTVLNSDGEVCKGMSYLEFLLQPKSGTIRMMYDLTEDVCSLCQMIKLSIGEMGTLISDTKLHIPPYHLRYIPYKLFSIKRPRAFAYYADASQYVQYPEPDLTLEPSERARRAQETGEKVYRVLTELGIGATSLVSPARAYEKEQLKWLYNKRREANGDPVRMSIIEGIGQGIYGESWKKYLETARA